MLRHKSAEYTLTTLKTRFSKDINRPIIPDHIIIYCYNSSQWRSDLKMSRYKKPRLNIFAPLVQVLNCAEVVPLY